MFQVVLIALLNVALILIPMFVITTTNVIILHIIYRTARNFNSRQSLHTGPHLTVPPPTTRQISSIKKKTSVPTRTIKAIPIICLTFVFSYFPYIIACLSNLGLSLPAWWRTLAFYSTALNTISNPLIYLAVNLDFRRYVLVDMLKLGSGSRTTVIANMDISSSGRSGVGSGNSVKSAGSGPKPGVKTPSSSATTAT